MALAQSRLTSRVWRKFRGKMGVRFTRFVVAAAAAFAATEVALTVCSTIFHMTSTPAALIAWFAGAVVSYVLSRWAWERKGKPDVLRETIPFWVISAMVIVVLTLANKFGYHSASWLHLTHVKRALWVDFVWFVANLVTFALRFVIFHFVLFTDRTTAARAAATGPDSVPPGTREAPAPGEVPASTAAEAAPSVTVDAPTAKSPAAQNQSLLSLTVPCSAVTLNLITRLYGVKPGTVVTVPGFVFPAGGLSAGHRGRRMPKARNGRAVPGSVASSGRGEARPLTYGGGSRATRCRGRPA